MEAAVDDLRLRWSRFKGGGTKKHRVRAVQQGWGRAKGPGPNAGREGRRGGPKNTREEKKTEEEQEGKRRMNVRSWQCMWVADGKSGWCVGE